MNVLLTSWHYYLQQLPMTLKEFQKKEGLSHQKLAELLGVHVDTIRKIKREQHEEAP